MGRLLSVLVLALTLVACGAPAGEKPATPSSSPAALDRACERQRISRSFDRGCGASTMASAKTSECHRKDGSPAKVHVKVTFAPEGSVSEVVVDLAQPPEAMPEVEACVAAKFRELKMPPFAGPGVSMAHFVDVR